MRQFIFSDLQINQEASFSVTFTQDDINRFADLTGDYNPLHTDPGYAAGTKFGGTIVHGMLAASSFSRLIGMMLPGKHALYLSQEAYFRKPVQAGRVLTVWGGISQKIDSLRVVVIKTVIRDEKGEVLVDGIAKVMLLQ